MSPKPWFDRPNTRLSKQPSAVVIGSGIAGATTADALATKGFDVVVLERHTSTATEASGNPAGVLLPVLSVKPNPVSSYHVQAYERVLERIRTLSEAGRDPQFQATGIVHLLNKPRMIQAYEHFPTRTDISTEIAVRLTPSQTNKKTGLELDQPAFYYPRGGWVNAPKLCRRLLEHQRIQTRVGHTANAIERVNDQWLVYDADQQIRAQGDVLILTTANETVAFQQTAWLPLKRARGQLAYIAQNTLTQTPRCVVCHDGYFVPNVGKFHVLGATWDYKAMDPELRSTDQDELLAQNHHWLPSLGWPDHQPLEGRVAYRAKSPDHLPIAGPAPDEGGFEHVYADLHHGLLRDHTSGPVHAGLFLNTGHGARGLVSAYLAAQHVAAQITGEASPLDQHLEHAIHPARFLIRRLKKRPEDRI